MTRFNKNLNGSIFFAFNIFESFQFEWLRMSWNYPFELRYKAVEFCLDFFYVHYCHANKKFFSWELFEK